MKYLSIIEHLVSRKMCNKNFENRLWSALASVPTSHFYYDAAPCPFSAGSCPFSQRHALFLNLHSVS